MDAEPTDIFQPGNLVVVTVPGLWFGKVGEVIDRATSEVHDWWIEFTVGHQGAAFRSDEVMRVR